MLNKEIQIKNVYPEIYGDKYPVKTELDRPFVVTADVIGYSTESAEPISVFLKYREKYKKPKQWNKVKMQLVYDTENKYRGEMNFDKVGIYEYTIEVVSNKKSKTKYDHWVELVVDRPIARFAAWYEMFHRSQGKIPNKSATFRDCEGRLAEIKQLGFDVIYLPPIHPIAKTNRKGPGNTLWAGPDDPGCPWSIGGELSDGTLGGHKSVHPDLGTLDDFKHFVNECEKLGMEVALDIALTCSYDHPYIKQHPDWFFHNPDGTIKFAENPPKKYEDTIPLNFYPKNKQEMWNEMKSIFVFWIEQGVKTFRIDNPHTKPDEFWAWLIGELKKEYPEVILLSEAFTHYDKLELLAKLGMSQSYTYFIWRNGKNELIEYFTKLTNSYLKWFLRANLFTNTPDILPKILQVGGNPAFKMSAVLAATLSSLYGIYNGFELCEADAMPDSESYRNSEKYQYKVWNWDRPGNIKNFIARLNRIRKENPALHYYDNLRFYNSIDDNIIFYGKTSPDKKNIILVTVNLDPFNTHSARITVPVEEFGISSDEEYVVRDLITDTEYTWRGRENIVILDPHKEPAHILKVIKK